MMLRCAHWALWLIGTAVLSCAHARELPAIKQSGVLRLVTSGDYPPFNFYQGQRLVGYEVDVAEAVAAKLGLRIEWKVLPFDSLITSVRQDRADAAIASHAYTEQRAQSVAFTAPHYCTGGQLVSRGTRPLAKNELAGKVVAAEIGSTYAEAAGKLPGVKEVKLFPKTTDALSAFLSGRVDAWVTDRFVAKTAAEKNAAAGLQRGELLFTERISMILPKDHPQLQQALDETMRALAADGTLAQAGRKWIGEDISCR